MQTMCLKEQKAVFDNLVAPVLFVPWWSAVGSPAIHDESLSQFKSPFGDQKSIEDQRLVAPCQGPILVIPFKEDYNTIKFSESPGRLQKGQRVQNPTYISLQSSPPTHQAHIEFGLGRPVVSANFNCIDPCYNVFAVYGAQAMRGHMLLPLNMTEDGPIYVNARQYHGILRRQHSHAKAELENKVSKVRKPYLHKSRHLHAMRRARGCSGRFLNTKNVNSVKAASDNDNKKDGQLVQPVFSPCSEVLKSDCGNVDSGKELSGGYSLSGSEVTSIYSQELLTGYEVDHLCPALPSLVSVIDSTQRVIMSKNWVSAADGCCDLLKV